MSRNSGEMSGTLPTKLPIMKLNSIYFKTYLNVRYTDQYHLNIITRVSYVITYKKNTREDNFADIYFLHEEVIDIFHVKIYIPTIEKLSYYLAHVRIIGSMECGKTRNDF